TDLRARDVRGDREHGNSAAVGVVEPVDEVQVAGSAAARAYRELAGQRRVGGGRERRVLLVADVFPRDVTGAPNGVREPAEAVARQAVDAMYATARQSGNQMGRNSCHARASAK